MKSEGEVSQRLRYPLLAQADLVCVVILTLWIPIKWQTEWETEWAEWETEWEAECETEWKTEWHTPPNPRVMS